MARPQVYTPEFIARQASQIVPWFIAHPDAWFLIEYSIDQGFSKQRFSEWCKESKEFSDTFARAKEICELRLLRASMTNKDLGRHAGRVAELCLKNNHGYRDKHEVKRVEEHRALIIHRTETAAPAEAPQVRNNGDKALPQSTDTVEDN